ncbi:nucleoside diphosphate kinase regulator [Pseudomonas sp. GX19020]|uniref:nucleoside diphosphate kinase regulator n=1 Tax=Pseudomonas sp. GX19020 TaxID=2942277 RepID=UPI0020188564|nr:nucleoside diphosphate kinase regulator [Pseudomonas sp. GX19020]MCL4069463.1 nucleoside diphosphate kinase regulator [Pseudomonas sp. GX19020]
MSEHIPPPDIVISEEAMPILEKLAEGLEHRNQALAAHFFDELARAKTLPAQEVPADTIGLGSHVRFRDDTTGRDQLITLVLPEQADISAGKVSVATPIGIALIGLRNGARFSWETRDGTRHDLTILGVETPM